MTYITTRRRIGTTLALAGALATGLAPVGVPAQGLLQRLRERGLDDGAGADRQARVPAGVRVVRDVAYGADPNQRFDVYLPAAAPNAPKAGALPVIFFVHGGAWAFGDKAMSRVVEPKVAHWVEQGWVVISTNYRLLPTPVAAQADDVATAIAFAQSRAAQWGADPTRFALMGHSAGSHLVALISAGAKTSAGATLQPWRGSVLLDSAVLDLPLLMAHRHLGLYDRAFGTDPRQWPALSPIDVLARAAPPVLAVCSARRADSCAQADRFAARAVASGGQAGVLRENLSHGEINQRLGEPSDYTARVDEFLRSLR